MDWGDAPAWAAFALSSGALWISFKARGDGKRSADAAEASVVEAQESRAEARRSGDAAERSAIAAEETLADQRREAEARRAAEAEANRPRADLVIEHSHKAKWLLINRGTGTAANVRLSNDVPALIGVWPDPLELPPGEAHDFMMAGAMGAPIPSVIRVVWEGQADPVPLLVPPRVG